MVNRKNTPVPRNADALNENETSTQLFSTRRSKKERFNNDDLIVSLASAYENERARQVLEWERVGYQNIYRA